MYVRGMWVTCLLYMVRYLLQFMWLGIMKCIMLWLMDTSRTFLGFAEGYFVLALYIFDVDFVGDFPKPWCNVVLPFCQNRSASSNSLYGWTQNTMWFFWKTGTAMTWISNHCDRRRSRLYNLPAEVSVSLVIKFIISRSKITELFLGESVSYA